MINHSVAHKGWLHCSKINFADDLHLGVYVNQYLPSEHIHSRHLALRSSPFSILKSLPSERVISYLPRCWLKRKPCIFMSGINTLADPMNPWIFSWSKLSTRKSITSPFWAKSWKNYVWRVGIQIRPPRWFLLCERGSQAVSHLFQHWSLSGPKIPSIEYKDLHRFSWLRSSQRSDLPGK